LSALLLVRVAFAFAPPGTRQPVLNFDRMADSFEGILEELQRTVQNQDLHSLGQFIDKSAQPTLMKLLIEHVLSLAKELSKKQRPADRTQAVMLVLLRAVVDELDRATREQTAAGT